MKQEIKKTPLYAEHLSLGAKMVDFHGWSMPLYYQGITREVKAVREKAGLFDLSHMGEIIVKGKNCLPFLQFVAANDASVLEAGQMQYSFFLSAQGTVLDDFVLYRLSDGFMAVVNASNTDKIFKHLMEQKEGFEGVELVNRTDNLVLIGLQGPNSENILQEFVREDLKGLKYLHNGEFGLLGEKVLISRSGYTGEDGFEIYFENKGSSILWQAIMNKGKSFGLEPAGLGARDILRCEMGYPLYGQEWDETISPWEGGFSWVVKFNKDFIGKEALERSKDKFTRRLVGFVMKEKAVPRTGYSVERDGKEIGRVTSGTFSPTRNGFIGMAYIKRDFSGEGKKIEIVIRNKPVPAEIVKPPFVKSRVKH